MAKNGLTSKQSLAIAALLTCPTQAAAAEAAGIGHRTLTRYLQDPNFIEILKEAETALIADNVRALVADMQANRAVMSDIRDNPRNQAGVRLRAAIAIDNSLKAWRDLYTIEQRLTDLEKRLELNND